LSKCSFLSLFFCICCRREPLGISVTCSSWSDAFWWLGIAVASFVAWMKLYSTLNPVSTGMDDHLWAGIPPRYITKPTRSTQPCICQGSLNWVPALIGWRKGVSVTSAEFQITLCDPIWHVGSCSSGACLRIFCVTLPLPMLPS